MAQLYTPSDTSEKSFNLTEDAMDFTEEPPSPFAVNLPSELWLHVFSYLEHSDLKAIRLTCKLFSDLARFPLMKKSRICINSDQIDIYSEMFAEDQYLPFRQVLLSFNVEDKPEALKIVDKVFTKQLKCLEIYDSSLFQWIAEKPLPNLKKILICIQENNKQIEFGKWRLGTYEKLEDVFLEIGSTNVSDPLNLFQDILNPKFNLKMLVLFVDKQFNHLLDEVRKVYDPRKVKLEIESFDYSEIYDNVSDGSDLASDNETSNGTELCEHCKGVIAMNESEAG